MIRRISAAALAGLAAAFLPAVPAHADCHWVENVITVNGLLEIHSSYACPPAGGSAEAASLTPPRDSGWDAVCVRTAITTGQLPAEYCDRLPEAIAVPAVTPGLVGRAFRRLPLPGSGLVVQPPGGRTLVNFDTNFYTERGEFTRTVTLLGQEVELRIWPASFGWRFGDGESRQTSSPGSAYPDLEITHRYLERGRVAASVDTTYAAEFRVDGGPWREVAGTVTIPGESVGLRVVTARPVLVGY